MKRKAQLASVEFIFVLVVFMLFFSVIYFLYSHSTTEYILTDDLNERETQIWSATSRLLYTQGSPHNWDNSTLSSDFPVYIGFQNGHYELSIPKITLLASQNDTYYTQFKKAIGFSDNETDLSLNWFYFNGTHMVENTSLAFGEPQENYTTRFVKEHLFASGNDSYMMRMEVYFE